MVLALRPVLLVHVLCRKAHKAGLAFAAPPDAYTPGRPDFRRAPDRQNRAPGIAIRMAE